MRWLNLTVLLLLLFMGCKENSGTIIKVDMSYERDEGRFNPELGDVVSIAGSFNEWEPGKTPLKDLEGNWVFEAILPEALDTLEFKFVVSSTSNMDLPNSGWELIPNRILTKAVLEGDEPILRFNEPWSPIEVMDVSFAVSMSNQEVLDFFDPERDKVIVSGSFLGWDAGGITLDDKDKDGVYEQRIPIEINPVKPHTYKYRIIKDNGFSGYMPNDGWELIDDRVLTSQQSEVHYFNDQKRVARFLVDESWLAEKAKDGIQRSDMFQVRFFVGEESYLSEPLKKNGRHIYEASLQIPLIVDMVKWTIVENQYQELSPSQETVVTHKGAVITVN